MDKSDEKFAVITGASTGIGYEMARIMVEKGYNLLIAADEPEILNVAQRLANDQVTVRGIQVDLANKEGVDDLFRHIQAADRAVDVLILNAGVGVNGDFVRENSLEDEMGLLGLNVTGVVRLSKLVLPEMVHRGQGRVMITSSIAALMPGPFYATYAASKSFLLSFSEALHNELKGSGVTVTALMPGATDTEFFARAGMLDTKVGQSSKDDPAQVALQGIDAMMKGEDRVIAGSFMNKVQGFATRFLSDQQKAGLQRNAAEPGSGH